MSESAAWGDSQFAAVTRTPRNADPSHRVHFYEDEDLLSSAVSKFIAEGLEKGEMCVVVATASHRGLFQAALSALGVDWHSGVTEGRLEFVDAEEMLRQLMPEQTLDAAAFEHHIGGLLARKRQVSSGARLRAFGEMVDILWRRGERHAALHLEELWNDWQERDPFELLCSYAVAGFCTESGLPGFEHVCAMHGCASGDLPVRSRSDAQEGIDEGNGFLSRQARALRREIGRRVEVERELRTTIRELRRKQEELRQSQEQLQLVTDALPGLVAFVDRDQRYQFVSAGYERWFKKSVSEVLGKTVSEVVGPEGYQVIQPFIERSLRGETVTYTSRVAYRDGGIRFVEATYTPRFGTDAQVIGFVSLVSDVSERKEFEDYRARAAARSATLAKITSAIAEAVTSHQVFEALVDNVAEALGASSVGLWLVDPEGEVASLARSVGYSEQTRKSLESLTISGMSMPVTDAIRLREPVWFDSQSALVDRYPHLAAAVTHGRSYRVACLPLKARGRVLGGLGLTLEKSSAEAEEKEFLLLTARYAAQALERLRLLESERQARSAADAAAARSEILSHISRGLVESELLFPAILSNIVRQVGLALRSTAGLGILAADRKLHSAATHHPDPEAQKLLDEVARFSPVSVGEGVSGRVEQTGRSIFLPELDAEAARQAASPLYREFLERFPLYGIMCVPLKARGRILGTLTLGRCHPGDPYTSEDMALLEEIAERAAMALESSLLYQETMAARSRAEQLYRFAQSAVEADHVEQVYQAAFHTLEAAFGASRAAILTYDHQGVLRFSAHRGLSADYRRAVEGHSPWSRDAVAPEPIWINNVHEASSLRDYVPLLEREGIGALAFIPLVSGGRLLGKFMLYYERSRVFSLEDGETARAIANHLASVIARFSLLSELEETIHHNELFAGVLAHDLRNPLSAMLTAAQLVLMQREGEQGSDRDKRPLSRILSSGQRMSAMISQLLDFSRIRSGGGIAIDRAATDLGDICHQAIDELALVHPEWEIRREVLGDQAGHWDAERLLQVVSNLVANAGQHGLPGTGILLTLDGTERGSVTLEVHNQGAIPAALLPQLFDPFRSARHRAQGARGLGLGLFIVREIVRAHGGTVEVQSTVEAGTTFRVQLPRRGDLASSG